MDVSIIIPTYNGANKILTLLDSLEKQTFNNFETLVIIDGSTDQTESILKNSQINLQELKIVKQTNKGRAAVRNRGFGEARGELLIFIDDDMLLEKNTIELHVNHHIKLPNSILSGTAMINKFIDLQNDFYQYRFDIEEKWQLPFKNKLTKISLQKYSFTSGNLSMPRKLFQEVGEFDERLTDSEDFDFALRAIDKNIPIYHDYNVWAWHCDYINLEAYIKRQKEHYYSLKNLGRMRPEYLNTQPSVFKRTHVSFRKRLLLKAFSYSSFWSFILNSLVFRRLIAKKYRYKLYSLIIFSSSTEDK
jgi:glycosyltransferase involved in cell wall biosynthesis